MSAFKMQMTVEVEAPTLEQVRGWLAKNGWSCSGPSLFGLRTETWSGPLGTVSIWLDTDDWRWERTMADWVVRRAREVGRTAEQVYRELVGPSDAEVRLAYLESEQGKAIDLRHRVEEACRILLDVVGSNGPENIESIATRAAEKIRCAQNVEVQS